MDRMNAAPLEKHNLPQSLFPEQHLLCRIFFGAGRAYQSHHYVREGTFLSNEETWKTRSCRLLQPHHLHSPHSLWADSDPIPPKPCSTSYPRLPEGLLLLDFQTHIFCKRKNIGPSFDPTTISKFSDTMVLGVFWGFFWFFAIERKSLLSYPGLLRVLLYQHCGHCYNITCGSNLCTLLVWEALQSAKATFLKHFLCFCDIMIY